MPSYLPNLGDPPFEDRDFKIAKSELLEVYPAAAIKNVEEFEKTFYRDHETIVVKTYKFEAEILGWDFHRNWYYWGARTANNPIPAYEARFLNKRFGQEVRVDGFSGGKEVTGPVYSYNIDTYYGLLALIKLIMKVSGISVEPGYI